MKRTALFLTVLLASPALAPAANKEMIELQRDVAQLQDQVRDLQRSFDERFAALQVLVQQTLDNAQRSNVALENAGRAQQGLADRLAAPIAGLGSKVDSMGTDVASLRESINDLTERMNKIQQQLTDLGNTVKANSTPIAAPPPSVSSAPLAGSPPTAEMTPGTAVPPVKATTLYENALRDKQSGKADLALDEFQQYIRFYNDTEAAPQAQYYIGEIHYSQAQFDQAIQDFDRVLEAYPVNARTADAHYMKGKTLFQLSQRTAAAKEFEAVVRDFPNSSVAPQARAQLRVLGINVPGATSTRKRRS